MEKSINNDITAQPITVLGAGSWGTAIALHLARSGQSVMLWSIDRDHVADMQKAGENSRYLPGCAFPPSLKVYTDIKECLEKANDIFLAVPSSGFRDTMKLIQPMLKPQSRIAWGTKGLDEKTQQLLHEVAQEVGGKERPYAVLSGPSFAREVAAGLPTAAVVASHSKEFAHDLMLRFNQQSVRIYLSTDVVGVELGGVVKNVLAVATGIGDGMGFGSNARCALITRGLAEMMRLGTALGGLEETFVGLTGLGDLVLTCTDNQSRNRRFGLALGKGQSIIDAEREVGQVVEGKRNAELVVQLAKKHGIEMPISETVLEILQEKLTPPEAMKSLLSRAPKSEN